jgi:trimeric autotransporter adhesin
MKIIYKAFLILITLISISSCVKEEMVKVDPGFILSFQRDGRTDAFAGNPFYVIPTGSGEFLTLFSGAPGHVWGEAGSKGVDFNKADSLSVQYNAAGKYNLSLVSTSSGNYGKEISRQVKTVEINTVDDRNSFTVFNINGVDGVFSKENDISFSVPDIVTDFHFIALFGLQSDLSKVYVNGIEQTSGVTANDFSQPVVYTVISAHGSENHYTVKFTTFPASSDKEITRFVLGIGGNSEIGEIDEPNKTINLTANYATNLAAVRLILESSYASKIYLNNVLYSDRKNYNLTAAGLKAVKVIAQDNSEVIYTINAIADNPVSSFTFAGLVPAPIGIIDVAAKTISVDVLKGTDITKLAAIWIGSVGKVTIGVTVQTNGVTLNDFSTPKTYTFYKGSTAGDKYVVTVKVK